MSLLPRSVHLAAAAAALLLTATGPSTTPAGAASNLNPADTLAHAALVPNDPSFASASWPAETSGLEAAWDVTLGSPTVTIAVVDTGVTPLSDLAGALVPGIDLADRTGSTEDPNGHGTAVASIIAARTDNGIGIAGVCGACRIMPIRVLNANGSGSTATIAAGVTWAVKHGADVINLSLAGSQDSPVLDAAIASATAHNVTVVVAAGNGGSSDPNQDGYPAAAAPTAIRVAGVDQNGALYPWSNHGAWVDIAAPGSATALLANGTLGLDLQGTSMAAPYVAGTIGLMLSENSGLSPTQVKQILLASGSAASGLDVASGKRLDAYNALVAAGEAASSATATPPAVAAPTSAPDAPASTAGRTEKGAHRPHSSYERRAATPHR